MKKDYLNPKSLSKPGAHTHVVSAEGAVRLVYVSGQIAFAQDGTNVTHALEAAGAQWSDVVKLNGYMVDMSPEAVAAYREVRAQFLKPGQLPASTLVGVTRLVHEDLLLEVEAVAALGAAKPRAKAKKKRS